MHLSLSAAVEKEESWVEVLNDRSEQLSLIQLNEIFCSRTEGCNNLFIRVRSKAE